jgi:hypothetical protein
MEFLLKRRDGRDITKKRYCPVQNGTYGQPMGCTSAVFSTVQREATQTYIIVHHLRWGFKVKRK